ncbi:cytidine deaminase [Sporobacter termitidis DSM 10068]|uniref:Cytidine deaminase n=1 Tax=Sporobacter termitidis DSM 10068 TaxID=1123282 RepID=A0A1M5XQH6_9FIRM|nr:cytidine deaminase [Sporobacter termitidis]SHI02009.1 cytidine deaminase [Sporobacter termitidis DSM 10068]
MDHAALLKAAVDARKASYCPYSHFAVGAALLCSDGTVYIGANIENASFSPTVCAERVAFFKAVSDGKRDFTAIAVSGGREGGGPDALVAPCGVCRQVMMEFAKPDAFEVVLADGGGNPKAYRLSDILPLGFGPENLA